MLAGASKTLGYEMTGQGVQRGSVTSRHVSLCLPDSDLGSRNLVANPGKSCPSIEAGVYIRGWGSWETFQHAAHTRPLILFMFSICDYLI